MSIIQHPKPLVPVLPLPDELEEDAIKLPATTFPTLLPAGKPAKMLDRSRASRG
jgi:hypothetical protein